MASSDDDIERLLREVDASTSAVGSTGSTSSVPAKRQESSAARREGEQAGSRFGAALRAGLVGGAATAVVVWLIFALVPFLGTSWEATLGAFVGGFVNALWFRYRGSR